jgi:hypothetical protein
LTVAGRGFWREYQFVEIGTYFTGIILPEGKARFAP